MKKIPFFLHPGTTTALLSNFMYCALQVKIASFCFPINQIFLWVIIWLLFKSWLNCCFVDPANKSWDKTFLVLSDWRRATSYGNGVCNHAHSHSSPLLISHQLFWQIFKIQLISEAGRTLSLLCLVILAFFYSNELIQLSSKL